jgi:hypothetical protein
VPGNPPPGCYIERAYFTPIPEGEVPAKLIPDLTGARLMARFDRIGEFVPSTPCLCRCGEYRQYVRGTYTENGRPVTQPLGPGRDLDPNTFHEDGDPSLGTAYGYHSGPARIAASSIPIRRTGAGSNAMIDPESAAIRVRQSLWISIFVGR